MVLEVSATLLKANAKFAIDHLKSTLTFGAQSIDCTKGGRDFRDQLQVQGVFEEVDVEVAVIKDDFSGGVLPQPAEKVSVDGEGFRVESVLIGPKDVLAVLMLMRS